MFFQLVNFLTVETLKITYFLNKKKKILSQFFYFYFLKFFHLLHFLFFFHLLHFSSSAPSLIEPWQLLMTKIWNWTMVCQHRYSKSLPIFSFKQTLASSCLARKMTFNKDELLLRKVRLKFITNNINKKGADKNLGLGLRFWYSCYLQETNEILYVILIFLIYIWVSKYFLCT